MVEATDDKLLRRVANTVDELEPILGSIVTNDTAILDALAQLLNTLHHMQLRTEKNEREAAEKIATALSSLTTEILELKSKGKAGTSLVAPTTDDSQQNPEIGLLEYLYSFLPDPTAIDVGANVGTLAKRLLQTGYEVYSFEPYEPIFAQLKKLSEDKSLAKRFHPFQLAIGSADTTMDLHIATDTSPDKRWDGSLFNSLVKHPMLDQCQFKESVSVKVRSIASLIKEGKLPKSAGLLKIDSEGFDLEVVKGLGDAQFNVVMTEFWDADHPFGRSGHGQLRELVDELRDRGYKWYLVIYHHDESKMISYYCNRQETVTGSWGNALFFNDYETFVKAMRWCESVLKQTFYR